MSYGIDPRGGLDPVLLWLWCRLAAVAPVQPLTWGRTCASGAALKSKRKEGREVLSVKDLAKKMKK